MKIFFTSDNHFGHKNIIKHCNRPFYSVEQMNECMIEQWNLCVGKDDIVYHLGDFSFRHNKGSLLNIFERLNGTKHLNIGNHDNSEVLALPWASVSEMSQIQVPLGDQFRSVLTNHYGMNSWVGQHEGAINLHGHHHGNRKNWLNRVDVGVDVWNFKPVQLSEIIENINGLPTYNGQKD